ncbi:MAG: type II secretion system major pseudopilin GspG [Planctomycetota bacterium]
MPIRAQRSGRRRRGFTIIEVIVIITILGIIAAVVVPRLFGRIGQGRQGAAKSSANNIAQAVELYRIDMEGLPDGDSLDFLIEPPSAGADKWQGPYLNSVDDLIDPWGNPYVLRAPGEKNFDYDVVSYGKDGEPGGDGEDADVAAP